MLKTLRNAFKIKEIRNRLFYTFLMLIVIRIGSQLPVPGVDRDVFANWFATQGGNAFSASAKEKIEALGGKAEVI